MSVRAMGAVSADQAPGVALHQQFGFNEAGRHQNAGFQFNPKIDLLNLQRQSPGTRR